VQKNVAGVQVAMHNAQLVHFLDGDEHLSDEGLRLMLLQKGLFHGVQSALEDCDGWRPD